MRQLFKNIWEGPATTFAAAISGSVAVFANSEFIPDSVRVVLGALAAFLLFYGPNKIKKKP